MKRATLDDLMAKASADTIRANPGLATPEPAISRRTEPDAPAVSTAVPPPKRATGQKNRAQRPSTKAEAEWIEILRRVSHCDVVDSHPVTLIAPDGDRYTPDIGVFSTGRRVLFALYEVKAGYRGPGAEQGRERFKRFRELCPWAPLRLAEKRRDGWYVDGAKWDGCRR